MNANLMRNGADWTVYLNTASDFDGSDSASSRALLPTCPSSNVCVRLCASVAPQVARRPVKR